MLNKSAKGGYLRMDMPTAVLIVGLAFSGVAVFYRMIGPRQIPECSDHKMVMRQLEDFEKWLNKVESKLDRVLERQNDG